MSSRIRELDELGAQLAAARMKRPGRRALPRTALVVVFVLAFAVPAVATRGLWAPVVGGETPLPDQAPAAVQTLLAAGTDDAGPWRLVAYRARLRSAGFGTCLFLTTGPRGTGTCAQPARKPVVATHQAGPVTFVIVAATANTSAVTARWVDGRRQQARVREAALPEGGSVRFALLQRSGRLGAPPALKSVTSMVQKTSTPQENSR